MEQFVVNFGFVGFVNNKKNTEYQETPPLSKPDSVVQ